MTCLAAIVATPTSRVTDILSVTLSQEPAVKVITSWLADRFRSLKADTFKSNRKSNQTTKNDINVTMLIQVGGTLRVLEFMTTAGIQHQSIRDLADGLADAMIWLTRNSRYCSDEEAEEGILSFLH